MDALGVLFWGLAVVSWEAVSVEGGGGGGALSAGFGLDSTI